MPQLALHSLSPSAVATLGASGTGQGGSDYSFALYSFLDRLSPIMFERLYSSSSSVLSIFRLLPLTARHLVLNLLWLSSSPPSNKPRRRQEDSPMSGQEEQDEQDEDQEEEEEGPSEITLKEMSLWVRERKSDGGDKSERRYDYLPH